MNADRASRSAVLVCQGRAAADGRIAPGRFADPVALTLLRDEERVPVQRVRDGVLPKPWAERFAVETVRADAEAVVPRTVAIDDAIRARCDGDGGPPVPQLILGAGLGGRAWRMPELADVDVFEVAHPASQRDKRDRLGDREPSRYGSCRSTSPATGWTPRWRRPGTGPATRPRGYGRASSRTCPGRTSPARYASSPPGRLRAAASSWSTTCLRSYRCSAGSSRACSGPRRGSAASGPTSPGAPRGPRPRWPNSLPDKGPGHERRGRAHRRTADRDAGAPAPVRGERAGRDRRYCDTQLLIQLNVSEYAIGAQVTYGGHLAARLEPPDAPSRRRLKS